MAQDLLALAVINVYLLVFAKGVQWFTKRELPFSLALGLVTLVTVTSALGLLGIPAIFVAQPVIIALALAGAYRITRSLPRKTEPHQLALIAIGVYCVWFWTRIFAPIVALPSYHDGIAHLVYYSRILETGLPLLTKIPLSFENIFGPGQLNYYPAGTHVLAALFSWLPLQLGMEPTILLKSFLLATNAAVPLLAYHVVVEAFPKVPKSVPLIVSFLAITYYAFPIWATDQGGFSRVLAYTITIPLALLLLKETSWPFKALALALCAPGIYLMHPGAFVLFGLAGLASAASGLPKARKDWMAIAICGTVGVALLLAFFLESQRNFLSVALQNEGRQIPFSLEALLNRVGGLLKFTFTDYFQPRPIPSLKGTLWLIGAFGFLRAAKRLESRKETKAFFTALMLTGLIFVMLVFFSSQGIRTIGLIFYHLEPRVSELLYVLQVALAAAGAWTLISFARKKWIPLMIGGVAILALIQHFPRVQAIQTHFAFWFRQYYTAHRAEMSGLITSIKSQTEQNALLVYPQFQFDILPAATARAGVFGYGECPSAQKTLNCDHRTAYADQALRILQERMNEPNPEFPCMDELPKIPVPVYLITRTRAQPPEVLCADLTLLNAPLGFVIARLQTSSPAN